MNMRRSVAVSCALAVVALTGLSPSLALGQSVGTPCESAPVVVDWDGDGILDLIAGDDSGLIYLFCGVSGSDLEFSVARMFTVSGGTELASVHSESHPAVGDWDCDGDLDLIVGDDDGGYISVFLRGGSDTDLTPGGRAQVRGGEDVTVGVEAAPCLFDWDNDGLRDLIVGAGWTGLYVFRNVGTACYPLFSPGTVVLDAADVGAMPDTGCLAPWAADWNGDGLFDLILGSGEAAVEEMGSTALLPGYRGYIYLHLNVGVVGAPRFEQRGRLEASDGTAIDVASSSVPCVVDWDGDGVFDLVVGSDPGFILFYRNVGTAARPVLSPVGEAAVIPSGSW